MKLTRLKLKNFRQYRDASVEFQDGMTAIVGPNGSGKTTLLEAISFALFGEVRGNLDSVPHMWNESAKFEVELEFELGETTYRAWRSDAAANLSAHTPGGWQELSRGKEDTKRRCTSLLGLTYDHFKNSFVTEQKQIAFLNFESRTERAAQVAKMLGLDLLQKSEVTAKDRARDIVGQLKGMATVLNADPKQLEKDVKDAQASVSASTKDRDEAKKEYASLSSQGPMLKAKAEEAQRWLTLFDARTTLQHQIDGVKKRIDQARIELALTEKKAAEAKSIEPDAQKYLLLEAEKKALDLARTQATDRISKVKMLEDKSKDLLDEKGKLKNLTEPDLKAAQSAEATASANQKAASEKVIGEERTWHRNQTHNEAEGKRLLTEKLRLEKELASTELSLAQGICPTCGQATSGEVPLVAHLKNHLKESEKLLEANKTESASLKTEPNLLTEARNILKNAEAAMTQAVTALRKAEADSAAFKSQLQIVADLEDRIAKMKVIIDGIPVTFDEPRLKVVESELEGLRPSRDKFLSLASSMEEAKQRATSLNVLTTEQAGLDGKEKETATALKTIPFEDKTKAEVAMAEYANYETKLQAAQRDVVSREQILAQCQKMLEGAQKDLDEYRAIKAKTQELKKSQDLHEVTAREMRLLREKLNGELRPDLEARASENLSLLTNGRYTSLQILENFDIRVFDENAVKTTISGGEEDILALALRLALSELIQEWQGRPMSLLILDEVFSSLDSSRRQSVADRLVTLKDRFKQILVISHIEDTLQVADHCIYLSYNPHTRSTDLGDPVLNIQEALLL